MMQPMQATAPRVSVIMIFLNAQDYIQEAIESVFAQTYPDWELILVDDGSTDAGTALARAAAARSPERVLYVEHPGHENRGMSAARNLGLAQARGEYVAFLDADDTWFAHALQEAVTALDAHPNAGMAYSSTEWWYSWTRQPEDAQRDFRDAVTRRGIPAGTLVRPPGLIVHFLTEEGAVPCMCSVLVRREVLRSAGGFAEEFRGMYEDQAFYAKVGLAAPVFVADGCWGRYRQHPDSCCAVAAQTGQAQAARRVYLDWLAKYLRACTVHDPEVWRALGRAEEREQAPRQQQARVAELERSKAWLEEQWHNWKKIADQREGAIQELREWIVELERGKSWLAEQRLTWMGLAREREQALVAQASTRAATGRSWGWLRRKAAAHVKSDWEQVAGERRRTIEEQQALLDELQSRQVRLEGQCTRLRAQIPAGTLDGGEPEAPGPAGKEVKFGSLRRLRPISQEWGYDRGLPVDRYYIEGFLARHATDVRGRVLEIDDNAYTRRFGGEQIAQSDVLDVDRQNSRATIIADLGLAGSGPSEAFDCIIFTQTLHVIYDFRVVVRNLCRMLKPGGVLLATFPGITRTSSRQLAGSWYWGFTSASAQRVFAEVFAVPDLLVESHGNVLSASAFLYGLAADELLPEELNYRDPEYDVIVTVRAAKRVADPGKPARAYRMKQRTASPYSSQDRKALVLLYHRVAETMPDPWVLGVSPQHFAEQLEVLNRIAAPVSLLDLASGRSKLPRRAVAVTFDDGYADNLWQARPSLLQHGVPATVFLTLQHIGHDCEYWWDELERILLCPGRLPERLQMQIGDTTRVWELDDAANYSDEDARRDAGWRAWQAPPSPRHRLYATLWEVMAPLPVMEQQRRMEELRKWAGAGQVVRSSHRVMSLTEVSALVEGGLVDVGSHTLSHPVLSALSPGCQQEEIGGSKAQLEQLIGRPVRSFAYPYGKARDLTQETVSLVRQAGYVVACSNSPGIVSPQTDHLLLPRQHVSDWDGDEFERELRAWYERG